MRSLTLLAMIASFAMPTHVLAQHHPDNGRREVVKYQVNDPAQSDGKPKPKSPAVPGEAAEARLAPATAKR